MSDLWTALISASAALGGTSLGLIATSLRGRSEQQQAAMLEQRSTMIAVLHLASKWLTVADPPIGQALQGGDLAAWRKTSEYVDYQEADDALRKALIEARLIVENHRLYILVVDLSVNVEMYSAKLRKLKIVTAHPAWKPGAVHVYGSYVNECRDLIAKTDGKLDEVESFCTRTFKNRKSKTRVYVRRLKIAADQQRQEGGEDAEIIEQLAPNEDA